MFVCGVVKVRICCFILIRKRSKCIISAESLILCIRSCKTVNLCYDSNVYTITLQLKQCATSLSTYTNISISYQYVVAFITKMHPKVSLQLYSPSVGHNYLLHSKPPKLQLAAKRRAIRCPAKSIQANNHKLCRIYEYAT